MSNTIIYKGHIYPSESALARSFGLSPNTYLRRRQRGWSLEETLEKPLKEKRDVLDHKGRRYPSVAKMCEVYGIDQSSYITRRKSGWDIQRALTKPVRPRSHPCRDFKGNMYPSIAAMCAAYGISPDNYRQRIETFGWTNEKALTVPVSRDNGSRKIPCMDHKGIHYPTKKAMAEAYGLSLQNLENRQRNGWPLKKALTLPVKRYKMGVSKNEYQNRTY